MKIAITGASGFIGSAASRALAAAGHDVLRIGRSAPDSRDDAGAMRWDPAQGELDSKRLAGIDAMIHLAGDNIASGRWTAAKKQRLRDSRVDSTKLVAETIAALDQRPRVFLSASAMGFYGSRGDEVLDEGCAMGEGFLAELCRDWEAETRHAQRAGIRTVQLRFGVVVARTGGAVAKMLLPFRLGLGGRLGSGRQWMGWIALSDAVRALALALEDDRIAGPTNIAAPNPVTNAEFTRALGRALSRPTPFPMPAFAVKAMFGEMGECALLASLRVVPRRLQAAGFEWEHPHVEDALRAALAAKDKDPK